jgi:Ras-related protein Rab-6A
MNGGRSLRIVTCGEASVGKTAILKRMMHNTFNANEPATVGSDYMHFSLKSSGSPIEVQIWDTAGEEQFRSIVPLYFRNSVGGLLVFDQTNADSLQHLSEWEKMYQKANNDKGMFIVVGNKADLTDDGCALREEGFAWARERGYPMFCTSAKTGEGIAELTAGIAEKLVEVHKSGSCQKIHNGSDLELGTGGKGKPCC